MVYMGTVLSPFFLTGQSNTAVSFYIKHFFSCFQVFVCLFVLLFLCLIMIVAVEEKRWTSSAH